MKKKTSAVSHTSYPKPWFDTGRVVAGGRLILALCGAAAASAQDALSPTHPPAIPTVATTSREGFERPTNTQPLAESGSTPGPSAGVADLLRLAEAGVSPEVMRTYVECSTTAYQVTHQDIIALKSRNVPDDVVTAMLKRGAELRSKQAPRPSAGPAVAPLQAQPGSSRLDPESYDYFQHYYLFPRTLASVYQRLPHHFPSVGRAYVAPVPFGLRTPYPYPPRHPGHRGGRH
ncbi:MAG: hypothetical protein FJ387_22300 [Verrucomicrobia bacterium]|nr:hypothetical protein [Verrucomicrobiota bacterium]